MSTESMLQSESDADLPIVRRVPLPRLADLARARSRAEAALERLPALGSDGPDPIPLRLP